MYGGGDQTGRRRRRGVGGGEQVNKWREAVRMSWMWDHDDRDYRDERQERDERKMGKEEDGWKEDEKVVEEWRKEKGMEEGRIKVWYV